MKEKHAKHIDKLLGELGLHPRNIDPDADPAEHAPRVPTSHTPVTGSCGKTCYLSESSARKCAKRIMQRGANTSFLRPYFCQTCKAWHITSARNLESSSTPKRNADRKRRNQPHPDHES